MLLGSERLLASSRLNGLKVGILANPASVDQAFRHIVDQLGEASDFTLAAIFGPQHGFRSDLQDNMIETPHGTDPRRSVPIFSLYSETREPTKEMLDLIDVLVIDLQDVGARIYTFIYTMANCLRAAAKTGTQVIVCDRPNPIGGLQIEGPMLEPGYESFVGQFPIPMRHGMTPGELAALFVGEFGIGADLKVVPLDGWTRTTLYPETGLPWIPPSPNMPSVESALHYPGTCLFEGTNISVGRGTDRAFQLMGAPWLDGEALAQALGDYSLPGVSIESARFTPREAGDGKFSGEELGGVRLRATGPDYDPTVTALALLVEIHKMSGERWEWRVGHFDRLAGTDRLRLGIEAGETVDELRAGWDRDLDAFRNLRAPYLLY